MSPLLVGGGSRGPPPENFEILYLRKMKLLIRLKNAGFLGIMVFHSLPEIDNF
jgi:hypothetical protein